jgi:hypothetical protein
MGNIIRFINIYQLIQNPLARHVRDYTEHILYRSRQHLRCHEMSRRMQAVCAIKAVIFWSAINEACHISLSFIPGMVSRIKLSEKQIRNFVQPNSITRFNKCGRINQQNAQLILWLIYYCFNYSNMFRPLFEAIIRESSCPCMLQTVAAI